MREMKDSGIEWIGAIPINWDIAQFKKILIRNDGGLWGNDPSGQDDILVLRSTEQTIDGKWDIQSPAYRDLSNVSNVQEYLVKCGDLLITKSSGSDLHIGKTTIVDELIESLHCSFSNFIQRLRVCSKMNPRYYWYILNSNIARGQFVYLQNSTSGIGNINSKNINEIEVPIPPLDIQHTIADYLDRKCSQIDAIIARQQEVIEKLKAYKLSVITEAVTKGLNPDVPMKKSGVDFIGCIPETWRICRLRNIGTLQNGISKGGEFFGHGFPFVSYGDVYRNFSLPVQVAGLIDSSDEERRNYSVESGDIFFTRTSETIEEVGFSSVCEETIPDATFAGFLIRVRPFTDDLVSGFAKYYFRSNHHRYYLVKQMNLVTRASLGQDLLKSMPVLVPPKEEQIRITAYLDKKCGAIESSIKYKQRAIERLTAYKKSLIYEVVTGKKEV